MTTARSSMTEGFALSPERLLKCVAAGDIHPKSAASLLCPNYIRHGPARTKLLAKSEQYFERYITVYGSSKTDKDNEGDLRYFASRLREVWDMGLSPEGGTSCENGTNGVR